MTEDQAILIATHRHYKGGLYKVHGIGKHSETLEEMVIYEHIWPHEQQFWVRPKAIFDSPVEDKDGIVTDQVRFAPIDVDEKINIMSVIVGKMKQPE